MEIRNFNVVVEGVAAIELNCFFNDLYHIADFKTNNHNSTLQGFIDKKNCTKSNMFEDDMFDIISWSEYEGYCFSDDFQITTEFNNGTLTISSKYYHYSGIEKIVDECVKMFSNMKKSYTLRIDINERIGDNLYFGEKIHQVVIDFDDYDTAKEYLNKEILDFYKFVGLHGNDIFSDERKESPIDNSILPISVSIKAEDYLSSDRLHTNVEIHFGAFILNHCGMR